MLYPDSAFTEYNHRHDPKTGEFTSGGAGRWSSCYTVEVTMGRLVSPLSEFNFCHDPLGRFSNTCATAKQGQEDSAHPHPGQTFFFGTRTMAPTRTDVVSKRAFALVAGVEAAKTARKQGAVFVRRHLPGSDPYVTAVPKSTWEMWRGPGRKDPHV